ncbi:MAG: low specificity L-threonine aldolase [Prevotellaceae bacterium]|jgi:threonine aldolase|nr:low specificity L-threonine aldolase [Prevotellaceae bacterium]
MRSFASDNNSGVHADILRAIESANQGHAIAYGDDEITQRTIKKFKEVLSSQVEVFFTFTGTAANVLGLSAAIRPYNAVICSELAHINVDECGAPEKFLNAKLITVPTIDGKITVEGVKKHMHGFGDQHHVQPSVISVSQVTEMGTVYTLEELKVLADYAHSNNLLFHVDGARLANAAVSLGKTFKEMVSGTGVDILSFGGTKNGLMFGEAIVFFKPELSNGFKFIRKQGMQLASKMRYVAAQFEAYLSNDLCYRTAAHANRMAQLLAEEVAKIPEVAITQKVQANGIFAIIPQRAIAKLQKEYFFHVWDEDRSEVRWMTSFDTTENDIKDFVEALKKVLAK